MALTVVISEDPDVASFRQKFERSRMAKCDQGYLCEVCGVDVPNITVSDLYLRYVIGEVDSRQLLAAPERHIRCNPTLAQFIVCKEFTPVEAEGPFAKSHLDAIDVERREELVTAGWKRLQEVRKLGLAIPDYPLEQFRRKSN
ncbi:hypothetical protein SH668x_003784 [Planctomicrobium sp. SH668]|uniref:hypothetical protein n=1 Tax=Planctomicrobium sp. SH668 TaxID=3448126 RepID=UPI003F5B4499